MVSYFHPHSPTQERAEQSVLVLVRLTAHVELIEGIDLKNLYPFFSHAQ